MALIDIDTFKEINDSFGHLTGDELLRIVGERLSRMTDDRMFVSRFAGDEFGLIFSGSEADGVPLFEAIPEDMRQPIKVQGTLRRYSVSMGVAFFLSMVTMVNDCSGRLIWHYTRPNRLVGIA